MHRQIKHLTMPDASVLYYECIGQGEPLILLHGNGGSSRYFHTHIHELSKYYKLYIIDCRGRGWSTDQSPTITYSLMVDDLLHIIQFEQLTSFNLLGFSDGANLALLFAERYPYYIRSLILNAANQHFYDLTKETQQWFKFSKAIMQKCGQWLPVLKWKNHYFKLAFDDIPIDEHKLKQASYPVLILVGENDIVDLKFSKKLASLFKRATLIVELNVGHFFAKQKPKQYCRYILNFLNENKSSFKSISH